MAHTVTDRGRMALAILLIAAGAVLLVLRLLGWSISGFLWPFFVIIPGVALLAVGLATSGSQSRFPAVAGAIVTTTGLILLLQSLTDYFQSWAYAWALLPAAAGGALVLVGGRDGDASATASGWRLLQWGVVLFALMGLLFEAFIFSGGWLDSDLVLPIILIAAGVLVLASWVVRPRSTPGDRAGPPGGEPPEKH